MELHLSSQLQSAACCSFLHEPTHFRKSYYGSVYSLALNGARSSPQPLPPFLGLPGQAAPGQELIQTALTHCTKLPRAILGQATQLPAVVRPGMCR